MSQMDGRVLRQHQQLLQYSCILLYGVYGIFSYNIKYSYRGNARQGIRTADPRKC